MSRPDPLPIEPCGPVDATVAVPGSKSVTNRALICAALAAGTSSVHEVLVSDDTTAMEQALGALGVGVVADGDIRSVTGGSIADAPARTLDARQSGTTARFLLPVLAVSDAGHVLDGDQQLRDRPMGPAIAAMRQLGAVVEEIDRPGHLPVRVHGPYRGGSVAVAGDTSSQFLSGLLLAGPSMPLGLEVRVTTELVSRPYADLTVAVMRAFGAVVHEADDGLGWTVEATGYRPSRYLVEPDASAASYPWAAAVLTGGRVTVPGLCRESVQGDVAFAQVLASMGARVRWDDDAVTVAAGSQLHGVRLDMAAISDTVPTLAVVAAVADSPTEVNGVAFIRYKESDRIAGPVTELRRAGIDATETEDGLIVHPGPIRPATFDTYRDHRMAMAFALLGLHNPGIAVRDPGCVAKTYPGFWDMLDGLRTGSLPPARAV